MDLQNLNTFVMELHKCQYPSYIKLYDLHLLSPLAQSIVQSSTLSTYIQNAQQNRYFKFRKFRQPKTLYFHKKWISTIKWTLIAAVYSSPLIAYTPSCSATREHVFWYALARVTRGATNRPSICLVHTSPVVTLNTATTKSRQLWKLSLYLNIRV